MTVKAIDSPGIAEIPAGGICTLCCFEHTCGLADTPECSASAREDGRDVYFVEIECDDAEELEA